MSEPWTCPQCQFEWVVPVGGECLSCGYGTPPGVVTMPGGGGEAREEQRAVKARPAGPVLENAPRDDPLAPLYPPGVYPPPVEETPVVNGLGREPLPGTSPLEQERQQVQRARVQQMQETFMGVMRAAKARIDALQHELSVQEQQVKEAVAAESEVRASLAEWQAGLQQAREAEARWEERARHLQQQLVQLAEANQQLRHQLESRMLQTGQTWPGLHDRAIPEAFRLGQVEQTCTDLRREMEAMQGLLQQVIVQLSHQTAREESTPSEAYSTFITTDSQAARVEQEILRSQAQYNQPWRG